MTGETRAPGWAWRDSDVAAVAITALLGLIAIIGAWFGAASESVLSRQAMWLNVAIAGFAISGVGLCWWLLRGRRAVGERRVSLVSLEPVETEAPAARPGPSTADLPLVQAPGMRRVHDPGCPLLAGKAARPAGLSDGEPCAVCLP